MKQQQKKSVSMVAPITLFIITFIFYSLYCSMDTVVEKIFVIVMALTVLLPFIPCILSTVVLQSIKCLSSSNNYSNQKGNSYTRKNKKVIKTKNIKENEDDSTKKEKPKKAYKSKTVENPEYILLKNLVVASSKNKLIDRNTVIEFKKLIDSKLEQDKELYKSFQFDNDFHEIYIKLKCSKLKTKDYSELRLWLSSNLNLEEIG